LRNKKKKNTPPPPKQNLSEVSKEKRDVFLKDAPPGEEGDAKSQMK